MLCKSPFGPEAANSDGPVSEEQRGWVPSEGGEEDGSPSLTQETRLI